MSAGELEQERVNVCVEFPPKPFRILANVSGMDANEDFMNGGQ